MIRKCPDVITSVITTFFQLTWTDFGKLKLSLFVLQLCFSWYTHRKCLKYSQTKTVLSYHRNEIDLALEKLKKSEKIKDDADFENNFRAANRIKSKQVIVQDKIYDVVWTIQIRIAFIAHLAIRVLMEMVFIALHYRLQMEQNGINVNTTKKDVSSS